MIDISRVTLPIIVVCSLLLSVGAAQSQDWELRYRYCGPEGQCGLPGSGAPLTSAPPNLRDADLAGRRYGPEGTEFLSAVKREQDSISTLRESLAELEDTPYGIGVGELNRQVLEYFSRPDLLQDLRSVYANPTAVPATGLPSGVTSGLNQTWLSVEIGSSEELVRAATLVRGLQRQVMALSDTGNQQAAQYLQSELRRNFVDANGLLRFLGNYDVYAGLAPISTPDQRLSFRLVDGVNKVISADFLLRRVYGDDLASDVAASLASIAAGYHAAASIGQHDQALAYAIADGLDGTLQVFDAFFGGFFGQGSEAVSALVDLISDPVATMGALVSALENYEETAQIISAAVEAKYSEFRYGDAETRAKVLGEISFDVAATFVGASGVKYGAKAVEFVADGGAKLAVTRGMARFARTRSVGDAISSEARAGLSFVEELRPNAALSLYDDFPAQAARIGEELNAFLASGRPELMKRTGAEFLRNHPAALDAYLRTVPRALQSLDAGESVKVYLAVQKRWTPELLEHGLKGPTAKKYWEGTAATAHDDGLRYGAGRYVASSPETAMLEIPEGFNQAFHDLIEADFKTVPNNGNGYRIYPSVQFPGEFNVFDGAFDDFGAFANTKVLP